VKRSPLVAKPPVDHSGEPGYREWKTPSYGPCMVCGKWGLLFRHHVILEQHLRAMGAPAYNLRNAMQIGAGYVCVCHRQQTSATKRIAASKIPAAALEYAEELLGEEGAGEYMARYYSG
jgi:hypothetical protein